MTSSSNSSRLAPPLKSSIRIPTPTRLVGHLNLQMSSRPAPSPSVHIPASQSCIPALSRKLGKKSSLAQIANSRRKNSVIQDSPNGPVSLIRSIESPTSSLAPTLRSVRSHGALRPESRPPPSKTNRLSTHFAPRPEMHIQSLSQSTPTPAPRPTLLRTRPSLPSVSNPFLRRPSGPSITRFPSISSPRPPLAHPNGPVQPLKITKNPSSLAITAPRPSRSRSHSSASRDSLSTGASSSPTTLFTGSDRSSKWDPDTTCPFPSSSREIYSPHISSNRPRPTATPKSATRSNFRKNITVLVRIRRPVHLPRPGQPDFIKTLNQATIDVLNTPTGPRTQYSFDHVFGPEIESQENIYCTLVQQNDLVRGFLDGFNATLIAYGQTGAGKSYTMGTGPASGPRAGVIPRALNDIFRAIEADGADRESTVELAMVRVAFLEVYNDELGDLLSHTSNSGRRTPAGGARCLSPAPISAPIHIREEKGGGISWTGLRQVQVKTAREALEQLQIGLGRRATNSTEMNAQSSRSHAIFSIMLDRHLCKDGEKISRKSKLNFVDLAGSERVTKTKNQVGGERFKEGIAINAGLHALGNVISALSSASSSSASNYIPYRESKLTRLLQDSLGGNSNTVMIACVSPEHSNLGETVSTLRYASRTREIKNKINLTEERAVGSALLDSEREELCRLRSQIENLKNTAAGSQTNVVNLNKETDEQKQHEFEEAIRPIVEEYEKSLSTLELELVRVQNQLSASLIELGLLRQDKFRNV